MSKFRIVKRECKGFDPLYIIQKEIRIFLFKFWWEVESADMWGADSRYKTHKGALDNIKYFDDTLYVDTVI